jgi:hypothetical protein
MLFRGISRGDITHDPRTQKILWRERYLGAKDTWAQNFAAL